MGPFCCWDRKEHRVDNTPSGQAEPASYSDESCVWRGNEKQVFLSECRGLSVDKKGVSVELPV